MSEQKSNALVYVLSSPSGGGKTTLRTKLLEKLPFTYYSVSCTTRKPRSDEVEGRDYRFVEPEYFKKQIEDDAFLEFAQVFDQFYGTPREPILKALKENRDVLLDLDPQGALEVKSQLRAVLIYIIPPSLESLKSRLFRRDSDDHDEILKRLAEARNELKYIDQYDYAVINDRVEHTRDVILSILESEKHKVANQKNLLELLQREIYKV